jgi:hypothetical protein
MKTKISFILLLSVVLSLIISCGGNNIELQTIHIAALKQIRFYKWKVSNLKVDTIKVNTVLDDKLTGFYSGHVEFGIDLDHDFKNHISGDSIVYIETKLEILNMDKWFIDEFQYMETGSFDNSERKALDEKANRLIYEKCVSEGTIQKAKENLEAQITDILTHKFNFKKVDIKCEYVEKL